MKEIRSPKEGETRRRYYNAMHNEGHSYRDIAKKVGVTPRTVWQTVHETRHKMR